MNTSKWTRFTRALTLALLGGMALWATLTQAAPGRAPLAQGGAPTVVAYQGQVVVGGAPYSGTAHFKFAVVNAAGSVTHWSNDGSSIVADEPATAVQLAVSEGLFSVLLGDTSLSGMTESLTADAFGVPDRYLRVWFSDDGAAFERLEPDTRIAAAPYALQAQEAADADTVDGEHASAFADASHNHAPGDIIPQGTGSSLDADTVDGEHASAFADASHNHAPGDIIPQGTGSSLDADTVDGEHASAFADASHNHAPGDITPQGTGSGLDADTVDGEHASAFADASHNHAPGDITPQGTGSGLDADTVDGEHASAFADASHNHAPGDITPQGTGSGLDADTVDGLHANELGTHYQNVVIVAKSGGDYTSVQAAIDSITDAGADNAYLVWVAPGVYVEQVTMKPHVHLQGAGQEATVITSTIGSGAFPPTQATLRLASYTSLRDLTVGNSGAGSRNVALLATAGVTRALAADVTVRAQGSGAFNYAILLTGSGTGVTLQDVIALGENGSDTNYGLYNRDGSAATLRGGSFTGRGGSSARGIYNYSSGAALDAASVTALGENGSNTNYGLDNRNSAATTLRGGSFTGRGGTSAYGIYNTTTLETESVIALGENGSNFNYGLHNGAATTLRGGSFTGRGGTGARGIYNYGSGAMLETESITALGENGSSYNYGLYNCAATTLHGGSFTARAGVSARGIYNYGSGTMLETESVSALGENSIDNYGLYNTYNAAATLRGGSFTGRGGLYAQGIYNYSSGATLDAESVTTLGEDGSGYNYGLYNEYFATANVTQSVLEGVTRSIYRTGGNITVSNSRLVGGAVVGTVTCVLVTRGTTISTDGSTCP